MTRITKRDNISSAQKYIENNLSEDLSIGKLASYVSVSPFHFQRLFLRDLGESVSGYIRCRRLERAAIILTSDSKASLINTALDCGFGSHSAFSKAFKQHFGMTPSQFSNGASTHLSESPQDSRPFLKTLNTNNVDMDVDFVELPTLWFQYKEQIGVHDGVFFPDREAMGRDLITLSAEGDQGMISICGGYRTSPKAFTDDSAIGSYGGLFSKKPTSNWSNKIEVIKAGKWAIFPHFGQFEDLHMTWNKIYRNWLPSKNLSMKPGWAIETYLAIDDTGKASAQIYIPLEK